MKGRLDEMRTMMEKKRRKKKKFSTHKYVI
jgi:hypothetical protein